MSGQSARHSLPETGSARPRPTIIAHRGASAIAPENTLLAFRLAIDAGANMIETDARITHDGEIVLLHDADLRRTTDCSGNVADVVLSELSACDAGYWFVPAGTGEHPFRGSSLTVPRLTELLDLVMTEDSAVSINVEIKNQPEEIGFDPGDRIADRLIEILHELSGLGHVLISSFNPETIDRVKVLEPAIRTAYLCGPQADLHARTAYCQARGHDAIHPHHSLLMSGEVANRLVDVMHGAGLEVNVWTVNDPQRMLEMAAAGVDGIITDDPTQLRKVLADWESGA